MLEARSHQAILRPSGRTLAENTSSQDPQMWPTATPPSLAADAHVYAVRGRSWPVSPFPLSL